MHEVFELRTDWRTKLILLALLDDAGGRSECSPDVERIAGKTGLSQAAINKRLENLLDAGALRPIPRAVRSNGPGPLRIELGALPKKPPFRGDKGGPR